jgi:hypothetical protein
MRQFCKLIPLACLMGGIAGAGVIDINFENIAPYPNSSNVSILNYYNGGTSSIGTTGTNYGISFPSNALLICLNTIGTSCSNTSHGGLGDPSSQDGALYFLSGNTTYLNDAAGFTTGFAFDYTAVNGSGGSVEVWSGLNGTGTQLASLVLGVTVSSCSSSYNAGFCPFTNGSLAFAGTGMSIEFDGVPNEIVYDDITFGSTIVGGGVPEPGSMIMAVSGLAGLGLLHYRRRRTAAKR